MAEVDVVNVSSLDEVKIKRPSKFVNNPQHVLACLGIIACVEIVCSDAHATGDAQGGQNSRQNGDYRLNDEFPSFFFHGILSG